MEHHGDRDDADTSGNVAPLDIVQQARAAAADRLVTRWWYHPTLGLLFMGYTVSLSLGTRLVQIIGFVAFFAGVAILVQAYQRIAGVWPWGHQDGPATRWAYAMGAAGGIGFGTAFLLARLGAHPGWIWAIGVLLAVAVVVLGHLYDRALAADLRAAR
ncbi:hypothetical protein HMPREF0063_11411 [Aeromicrobium marinum DSM 15272]|uniref:Uncharacterized protein n=1 Tax=Aeromicrobium marinum DSM 15272 TaxID=585531 RepID=E2SBK2_9ACTN|nr:hypothetical protein [Aeromicrobium marinum]EFQ83748.1 hypothetical protein HMPREF0063_11411 [Aeromicrobium marinum DSM 15272]